MSGARERRHGGGTAKAAKAGTECSQRRDGQGCASLNQVLIADPETRTVDAYSACSCGRRYLLPADDARRLDAYIPQDPLIGKASGPLASRALDHCLRTTVWPASRASRHAKNGIVPIGTEVLHSPTQPVTALTNELVRFSLHLAAMLRQAMGIGLAANQVGVPLRVLIHGLPSVAPPVLVNPELLAADGAWDYVEGCLSLQIDGTASKVRRPKTILVRAATIDGRTLVLRASELLARVLQHEIDHLNGIEYVQRLTGNDRTNVYRLISDNGIDTIWIPPVPY